jgi:hypothetical protein
MSFTDLKRTWFRGSVYDFLCVLHDKDIKSDFGRKRFEELDAAFADIGWFKQDCQYHIMHGVHTPTMKMSQLQALLFCVNGKDVTRARNLLLNMEHWDITRGQTGKVESHVPHKERPSNLPKAPIDPKASPAYFKLRLLNPEKIRGVLHTDAATGMTDIYWSVFDFLCITFLKPIATNYGRVKYAQLNKAREGEVERLETRLKIRRTGAETPTMTADQLISLSLMFIQNDCKAGKHSCFILQRVARDYTQCTEVEADE